MFDSKFLERCSNNRNLIFLVMCLFVHLLNVAIFFSLKIFPLMLLNFASSAFYEVVLLLFKKNRDLLIVLAYFEIIAFSLLSEILASGTLGYIYFVIGMVGVVVFLLPAKMRLKGLFQLFGIAVAIAIQLLNSNDIAVFRTPDDVLLAYGDKIRLFNIFVTIFTLFYVSKLYRVELNLSRERLDYTSNHDLLTGLYNRRFFESLVQRDRIDSSLYSIAMFDVDDFKRVNDSYGHAVGDEVLSVLSRCLSSAESGGALPVRWGGEEFILYMPNLSLDEALERVQSVVDSVRSQEIDANGEKIKITVTAGLASGTRFSDCEKVIKNADALLYRGKRNGKNQIVV